jgi:hypothetical protein
MRLKDGYRALAPWLILGVGWVALVAYAYPGFMSYDSALQLREARAGFFTDWHPPVMAEIWRWTDGVVSGPLGMLLLQSTAFVAGAYVLLRQRLSPIASAAVSSGVLLFPPIFGTMAVIWKDCQMVGFCLLGMALLVQPQRQAKVVALVALLVASAMRYNAFTITAAPVVLLFRWSASHVAVKRYALSTAAWIAVTCGAMLANRALTDEQTHPWESSIALFDITGVLHYAEPLTDDEIRATLAGTAYDARPDIQAHATTAYDPDAGWLAVWNGHFLEQPQTAEQRDAITRAWTDLVLGHPAAYLHHRWAEFREVIHIREHHHESIWVGFDASTEIENHPGWLAFRLQSFERDVGQSWMMRPILYLMIILAMLVLAIKRRDRLCLALGLSAILSELALFFLAPTPDFRYSIWVLICAPLIGALLSAKPVSYPPARAPTT